MLLRFEAFNFVIAIVNIGLALVHCQVILLSLKSGKAKQRARRNEAMVDKETPACHFYFLKGTVLCLRWSTSG